MTLSCRGRLNILKMSQLCLHRQLLISKATRMAELERGERLQIMLSVEELRAVEDWRFAKRMPSRAAAVRELLRRGLLAEGFTVAAEGVRSGSFGVLRDGQRVPNAPEKE